MISTKDIVMKNVLDTIEIILQNTYGLSPFEAKMAIKESKVADMYMKNFEMYSHDSTETWAETVYKFWNNNK